MSWGLPLSGLPDFVLRTLILFITASVLVASEPPSQPLMLPMDQLLKRLDQTQEWMFVPLADYRALLATTAATEKLAPGLIGARISTARITGTLTDDSVVLVQGILVVDAQGAGPHLCRLFDQKPMRLGAILCNEQPAVLVANDKALDILIPGKGTHYVSMSWGIDLVGNDQRRKANLPLPLAGAVALSLDAKSAGSFTGDVFVADLTQAGRWRLVRGVSAQVPLMWEPGRLGQDASAIFGVDQVVQASVVAGPSPLRCAVRLVSRRGQMPERVEVKLPPGWRLTQPASPGVVGISEQSDSQVRINLAPGTSEFACDGVRAVGATVALPTIIGAVYQGGSVMLKSDQSFDVHAPMTWRRLDNDDGWRRYAVAGPGDGVIPEIGQARWGIDARSSASVVLTDGQQPWHMAQTITLSDNGSQVGDVDLQVPLGWRVLSVNSDQPVIIRQLAGGGDVAELPPGTTLSIVPRAVGVRSLSLSLSLERVDANVDHVVPVVVRGHRRSSHRLTVLSTEPIESQIIPQAPWRMGSSEQHAYTNGALRAELFATGELVPLRIVTKRLQPDVGMEAVVYLAPGLDDQHWGRVDLRLRVRAGELNDLSITGPIIGDDRVQVLSETMSLERSVINPPNTKSINTLTLRARVPLVGDHLVRLEGALSADQLGTLSRLIVRVGEQNISVRQVIVVQAPPQADLVLNSGAGALPLAVDALPTWSRPLPGLPVSAAWRLSDGEVGNYRLDRRALAKGPPGFIDQLTARSQIDHAGTMTLLTARVAAPTVQALPLIVPVGMVLVQATIDGHEVAVRRVGTGTELPLPGRTQVQVALLFSGPSYKELSATREVVLPLPRLGDLPTTATAWTVAIAGGWHATVVDDLTAMTLQPQWIANGRPWFGSWWEAPVDVSIPILPAARDAHGQIDKRALQMNIDVPPTTGEPQVVLRGHVWTGTRLGGETNLHLKLSPIATLRMWDSIGWVLALVVGVLLTWCCSWSARGLIAAAGLLFATALHGWHISAGPLLAFSEWLAPAVVVAGCAWWLLRLRPTRRATTSVAALCLLVFHMGDIGAGESPTPTVVPTPVLMGYQRLDPKGVPQDVRVALTKAQLTLMWQNAQGQKPNPAVCDLATGTPRYDLRLEGSYLLGTLSVAVAVPGTTWQQVRIPVLPGTVRSVTAKKLGAVDPGTIAWSTDENAMLVLSLAPRQQADVVITLEMPLLKEAGAQVTALPLPTIPGGRVQLTAPTEWVPYLAERPMIVDASNGTLWTSDLPSVHQQVLLSLRRAPAVVARELHLGFEQRVRVALQRDHLEWQATVTCTTQGGGLRKLPLVVPTGLVLINVEGDGVADWSQTGQQVEVVATSERSGTWRMRMVGLFPLPTAANSELSALVRVPSAERTSGVLEMTGGAGLRFERPATKAVERVDPTDGADHAVRWTAEPGEVLLRWRADDNSLSAQLRATLSVGTDRVRVLAGIDVTGAGKRDVIRLQMPQPWHLVEVPKGVEVVWQQVNGKRICALRSANAWATGAVLVVQVEAERRILGAQFQVPDLRPIDSDMETERQVWLFASSGDGRLRLEDHVQQQAVPVESARVTLGNIAVLHQGERWLQACSWRGVGAPKLLLVADENVIQINGSHYLVLAQDRLRWSAHLVYQATQGELTTLRCTIPTTAQLTRVSADGLGSWTLTGRELVVTLAGPTRQNTALDLELELPLTGQALTAEAIAMVGGSGAQDIALVEEDELGLVHVDAQGLEQVTDHAVPFSCPVGIDHAAIRHRWRSLRPQWTLGIKRETLATSSGIDGVVTLADVVSVLGVDGESRSRGVWQVLNRTRTHLTIRLPKGVELWAARVAGVAVRPRQGAQPQDIVLPVTPQRPGESTQAISLTWRERLNSTSTINPGLPQFSDLRIMQGLWRVVPPPGYQLTRHGGTLLPVDDVEAEADRAQSVIDELKRLRGLGDLDDVGLKRLNNQLVTLDLQLSDNLVSLQQVEGKEQQSKMQQTYNAQVITDVNSNRQELQRELQRIDVVRSERGQRRNKLGLDNPNQFWEKAKAAPVVSATYATRVELRINTNEAQPLANDATLGAGQAPPGQRTDDHSTVLGLDLLGDPGAGGLSLRAQGNDLTMELSMTRTNGRAWPWLAVVSSLLLLGAGLWLFRR